MKSNPINTASYQKTNLRLSERSIIYHLKSRSNPSFLNLVRSLDCALMHVIGGTIMTGQTDMDPERNSVQTLIAMKDNKGEWRLIAMKGERLIAMKGEWRLPYYLLVSTY